ncbi:Conserved_hypothetical protein [Hexamita inflata]|uniref:Transmembrane protein n=1 Tax=Hexamita inflata TaxID=28002 RepID=A0AA86PX02_9EUKA|nr:Conserved hypothetical protein [Hexamita inflata]
MSRNKIGCAQIMMIIFSPVLLVLYIVYLTCLTLLGLIFMPIKFMIFTSKKNSYQHKRRNKYQNKNSQNQPSQNGKYLNSCDVMFLHKPNSQLDLFIGISNGQFVLLNSQIECINNKSISYYFEPGQEENFCQQVNFIFLKGTVNEITSKIPIGYQNNVCYYDRKVYFQVSDQIFVVRDLNVELVGQIPDYGFQTSVYYGIPFPSQIFTINDKLYVHNAAGKLYQVNTQRKKFQIVRGANKDIYNMQFFQFCDTVIALNYSYIYQVLNSSELFFLYNVQYSKVLFNSGGVLLLVHDAESYIFNMLDLVLIPLSPEQLELFSNIEQILVPDLIGFKIKDYILQNIISDDFPKRVQQRQLQYYGQYMCQATFNKLVFGSDLKLVLKTKFEHIKNEFTSTQNKITNQFERINFGLKTALNLQNHFVNSFALINCGCEQ